MRIEIEMSHKLYTDLLRAAKNFKMSRNRLILAAIRQKTRSNQMSGAEVTASLNKFFAENPDLNNINALRYWEN